jgi:phosphatidate cytidylyltransferase
MNAFIKRLLTSVVGIPIIILFHWWNSVYRNAGYGDDIPLLLLVMIIACASGWESATLVNHKTNNVVSRWNGVYGAIILPLLAHSINIQGNDHLGMTFDSIVGALAFMLLFLGIWGDVEKHGIEALKANLILLGVTQFIGLAMMSFILITFLQTAEAGTLMMFAAIFACDSGAYLAGSHIGGKPLAPQISPKKTISGALVGLVCAIGIAMICKNIPQFSTRFSYFDMAMIGAGIGILGQIGDLFESYFKRWAAVKDSGDAIPGHGGFLDRFDSTFLVAPFLFLCLKYLIAP